MSGTIVVTGAAGLIGSATGAAIGRRGGRTVTLTRDECDIADRQAVRAALRAARPSTVVHTAYLLADRSSTDHRAAAEVNIVGFLNMVEESLEAGAESFLYASSIAVYESEERSDRARTAPVTAYGCMKLVNEHQLAAIDGFGRHCGVRIANIYADTVGRGQTGWLSTAVSAALTGEPARVQLSEDAAMAIMWQADIGDRLAALALSGEDLPWPPTVDGGGERVTGGELASILGEAGAPRVDLGDDRYDYPSVVPSPWLDRVVGQAVVPLERALEKLRGERTS
jgi:nucleoside-diphosphate-sugar epimerase